MILTLFDRGKAFDMVLPEKITGRYVLTTEDQKGQPQDLIAVEAEDGHWYIKSNQYAYIKDAERQKKALVEPFMTYTIHRDGAAAALLYVEPYSEERNEFTRHIAAASKIKIGRAKDNHICFTNKLVSGTHAVIEYTTSEQAIIRDQNSANGTYVNGERISEHHLEIGDVISIMGLKIIFNGRLLALNNPHQLVFLDRNAFKPHMVSEPLPEVEDGLDDFNKEEDTSELFYRSPRFKRDIERKTIKIDPPPAPNQLEETPLMLLLGPSITMGMGSLATGVFAVMNVQRTNGDWMYAAPTLIMSISMLLGMILWPILTKRYEKKRRIAHEKKRQEKYSAYIEEMKQVIADECAYQWDILHENHIPLANCLNRIDNRERTLWERVIGQDDFLKIRVGIGDLSLAADIKFPEKKFALEDDNLRDALYELAETPQILKQVPITISLIEERVSGIIGKREKVASFVKGLIFQLSALHSYDEVKFVFLYDQSEHADWKFARWLPHVWDEAKTVRFIATDVNEAKELSAFFEKEMAARTDRLQNGMEAAELRPHYVVFSMSRELAAKTEMINLLLKEKQQLGFSLITMYDELAHLPKECTNVVELPGVQKAGKNYSKGELGEKKDQNIGKIYDKDDISGKYQAFVPDIYMTRDAEEMAVKLANIELSSSAAAYTLPDMLTFLEMFGVGKVEHLNALTRWKENNPTLTIETPIGVNRMGEPFMLDLHEKFHGPHGLIAGMTGSGKSEFIMTFILSLAVNYHPDEVAFILIDYKGGGMANAFLNLPHLAGTITNLDGAAVKRSLVSIQSELKRRQAIFSEASRRLGESNIDIYKYQKLYREGVVTEPLQHLFMISDEFAELKTQQPEFMEQLVSAARIGRSLGVHLILATQKPSGVVDDQIWSNSKFRISLKVQEKADSMEVIKRPDAAELSQTGRFYLQVGYNELFELGQSAWAGAPYYPADKVEKRKDDGIAVIDHLGRVVKSARIDKQKGKLKNPAKQIDEITKYLESLAEQEAISVKPLWLEPIPANVFVDGLKEKYRVGAGAQSFDLNPVIGEYDDPARQRQLVLRLPITQEGNTIVYGVAGSGKTTFLTTLIYSLMEEHTPEEVNIYALDFGSETLSWYQGAPHVGDVMLSHEAEKIDNLFKMLSGEVAARKKRFAPYGGDFRTYNRAAAEPVPALVVMIHNYSTFSETYEQYEETISYLTREGTKYGLYFVVTALNTGAVRYKLMQNFKQIYVLQLNDTTEYSAVLGSVDGVYPSKFKGRGIFKADEVYEFQTAQISAAASGDVYRFVTDYCRSWQQKWKKSGAKRIPILPEKVDLEYVRDEMQYGIGLPVGVEKATLQVAGYDFRGQYITLVTAADGSECVPFLQGLAEVAAAKGESEVVVLDPAADFAEDSSRSYEYVTGFKPLEDRIVELFNMLVYRNNTSKDALEAGLVAPVFAEVMVMIGSFSELNEQLSEDGRDKLKVFLEKGNGLNVTFVLGDSADKLNGITYEPWFQQHVSLQDAIWVGNGIADQYVLKIAKFSNGLYQELPEGFGYIIRKGKVSQAKLLTSAASEEGAVQYV
ncbi:type VII secretion protein EssC [Neobacillus kokaensis]|uniref:Type VII secretion protein EssC n=1 Tax=Neobacillus kokaensis TaxID=2759023 RepID=A0ABQ3N3W1_9BACI|nr:type VII secretion protein EssC [Neobacillus kokaensis]GHH98746.1 type VII secretion protein EssC [Neobacillus kokaensis]